jgi:hypothetical protein
VSGRPSPAELLERPEALLSRTHLRDLGWGRAQIDAIFRKLDVIVIPGTTRPMIRREDYLELVAGSTYGPDDVRPTSDRATLATIGGRSRERRDGTA